MNELMTVQKLADYLNCHKRTIYRMLERGNIPATKLGRQWRFNQALIDKWISEHSVYTKPRILVIDDDKVICKLFMKTLEELGYSVVVSETSLEGLEQLQKTDFDLVFLDLKMPVIDGAELFCRIRISKPKLPVIIITGYPNSEMMARALTYGPFAVMDKPFSESDIIAVVRNFPPIIR